MKIKSDSLSHQRQQLSMQNRREAVKIWNKLSFPTGFFRPAAAHHGAREGLRHLEVLRDAEAPLGGRVGPQLPSPHGQAGQERPRLPGRPRQRGAAVHEGQHSSFLTGPELGICGFAFHIYKLALLNSASLFL